MIKKLDEQLDYFWQLVPKYSMKKIKGNFGVYVFINENELWQQHYAHWIYSNWAYELDSDKIDIKTKIFSPLSLLWKVKKKKKLPNRNIPFSPNHQLIFETFKFSE